MPLDPRMFLGIGGPVAPQAMLPPGFHAPPPVSAPPIMQPQGQQGGGGMPGMGMGGIGALAGMFGPKPSTSGAEMGAAENNGLAGAISGIQGIMPNAAGGFDPPAMPTDIGHGGGSGGFMNWLRGLF